MSQENGKVNENQEAIIKLELVNGNTFESVIDTGFNGGLFLPRKIIEENGFEIESREILQAAEDQFFEVDTTTIELEWLGRKFSIPVFISETGESLMGTEMLEDSVLEIDYKNSTVKITK